MYSHNLQSHTHLETVVNLTNFSGQLLFLNLEAEVYEFLWFCHKFDQLLFLNMGTEAYLKYVCSLFVQLFQNYIFISCKCGSSSSEYIISYVYAW